MKHSFLVNARREDKNVASVINLLKYLSISQDSYFMQKDIQTSFQLYFIYSSKYSIKCLYFVYVFSAPSCAPTFIRDGRYSFSLLHEIVPKRNRTISDI